jgi:hypothetical protein
MNNTSIKAKLAVTCALSALVFILPVNAQAAPLPGLAKIGPTTNNPLTPLLLAPIAAVTNTPPTSTLNAQASTPPSPVAQAPTSNGGPPPGTTGARPGPVVVITNEPQVGVHNPPVLPGTIKTSPAEEPVYRGMAAALAQVVGSPYVAVPPATLKAPPLEEPAGQIKQLR